ncbi:hypothetical protein HMPREF0724_12982 [Prescottella equi ATCC 33707]|uniref:Uncharacterized protein n=1 Tax=Prescottella equi ATCC 33707 TaxID=525370 RepID=E9T2U1_RHOHA|nr:hypothetical protein HMPREF0724_12982 [Prescottella equi ATCC 33707]
MRGRVHDCVGGSGGSGHEGRRTRRDRCIHLNQVPEPEGNCREARRAKARKQLKGGRIRTNPAALRAGVLRGVGRRRRSVRRQPNPVRGPGATVR